MLTIMTTIERSGFFRRLTATVEGRFVGDWATFAEREVEALLEKRLPLVLELSSVREIDATGHEVLGRLAAHGIDVEGLPITNDAGVALARG